MRAANASHAPHSASPLAIASALAAVYVIWGSTYLAIRFALEGGYPPLLMAGGRFLIAGGLMYAVLRWRKVAAPTPVQWRNVAFMGLLLLGFGNGMVCIAEQTVSSGLAAVAVASAPLWMGLFSAMRGEHPRRLEWIGLGIGFIGVLWLNAGSSLTATPVGLVALLIAPLAWSFGSIWSRGGDLPPCLELRGDHLDQVLQEVPWPSRPPAAADTADTIGEHATDATDATDAEDAKDNALPDAPDTDTTHLAFGVTLDQIDTLNRLIETITAHGDVVAATDLAEFADGTLSVVGHAIFDAACEVREVLDEVNAQRLGPAIGLPSRVREARAGYGPAGASLH